MSMANHHRGEVGAVLDGKAYTLCLTLGALAELEERLGGEDILALARKFEAGRITARETISVIGAGLRGAGNAIADDDVARMSVDGGVPEFLSLVIRLLQAAFGVEAAPVADAQAPDGACDAPFPGGA